MTRRAVTDVSASVREKLLNKARQTRRPFNELLQYFGMERFLYRLSKSRHADKFVLKGALMLAVWETPGTRTTMDIDLLGRLTVNDMDKMIGIMKDVCNQKVEPDGIVFDAKSISGERITEAADYEGIRIRLRGNMGTARVIIQVDIGFGDEVVAQERSVEYPTLLDFPPPELQGYSKESMIAEKFEAMTRIGVLNSRMKDFYDIWLLSQKFAFDGQILTTAIKKTFSKRKTTLLAQPVALTSAFGADPSKNAQWRAFIRRNRLEDVAGDFNEIVTAISVFLGPVANAVIAGKPFFASWKPPGPWVPAVS